MEIKTDILIIGAGPCGLFTVFEAGLLNLKCHLIDYLPQAGGQLIEIYPKKPIYDIPGLPSILASDLIKNLLEQAAPFKPGFTLGERAETLEKMDDGNWKLTSHKGTVHIAPIIAIAGGLGCFEPRKPEIDKLDFYEENGVDYIVKNPDKYIGKNIVIAGGGDSALDWCIYLANLANKVTLIHRRTQFRGHLDSVQKVMNLAENGKINLILNAEVNQLIGDEKLESIKVSIDNEDDTNLKCDYFLPLFGLSPKLGPLKNWNLAFSKEAIQVNTFDYSTNIDGIYAIGDINDYPGKLRLILCGFHEATLMVQSAFKKLNPNKNLVLKYTTVSGVKGF